MQGSHLSKTKLVTNGSSYKRFCAAAYEEVDDENYDDGDDDDGDDDVFDCPAVGLCR